MKNYYSISQYPGSTGKHYFTWFFKHYNIDATYTPIGCDPVDFDTKITYLLNSESTSGISISMPYKKSVMKHCNTLDLTAQLYDMCNTLVVNPNQLIGYNCDIAGVKGVTSGLSTDNCITILGNGVIGKMFYSYLYDAKYVHIHLYSRSIGNWNERHADSTVIINCTALGTISENSPLEYIPKSVKLVIDLSMKKSELYNQCVSNGIKYISGIDFYSYQFIDQFKRYTGIVTTKSQFDDARHHLDVDTWKK